MQTIPVVFFDFHGWGVKKSPADHCRAHISYLLIGIICLSFPAFPVFPVSEAILCETV